MPQRPSGRRSESDGQVSEAKRAVNALVCVVDADGRKTGARSVDSTPEAIVTALEQYGPIERAVIETGRMTPSIALACVSWACPSCASTRDNQIASAV